MSEVVSGPIADAAIIAASVTEPELFAQLYERHARALFAYAARRLGRLVAEDIVADTFVAAFNARDRYDPARADARPWLFGIITKEIRSHYRAERARYRALLRTAPPLVVERDFADQVAESVTTAAERRSLGRALSRLSRKDRDVLLMIGWADLSHNEVAQALGFPWERCGHGSTVRAARSAKH